MIDARAVIDPSANIGENVTIGPFAIIGPDVEIGDDCWIGPHAVVNGPTRMGRENRIFQFASIGEQPQDKKYAGEPTTLVIGDRNVFRENVTVNRGTVQDRGETTIGNDNWIMAYCHVAHDCVIGNDVIMSNSASLAGHCEVSDHAILGGFTLVHQFCNIGSYSFCSFGSVINRDVPPYVTVAGHPAEPHGINAEGLKRHQFSPEAIRAIKNAYKQLYKSALRLEDAILAIAEMETQFPELKPLTAFLRSTERGILR